MTEERIKKGEPARDFTAEDTQEEQVSLSDFKEQKNVYLVLNRGFA